MTQVLVVCAKPLSWPWLCPVKSYHSMQATLISGYLTEEPIRWENEEGGHKAWGKGPACLTCMKYAVRPQRRCICCAQNGWNCGTMGNPISRSVSASCAQPLLTWVYRRQGHRQKTLLSKSLPLTDARHMQRFRAQRAMLEEVREGTDAVVLAPFVFIRAVSLSSILPCPF